ncbi:MAG TPA: HD domain-containing phosphohydrolase [Thermoleophilaceae bacterium]|nr:HD domain-containing phosphohydrolase [Thermoleophilaceae bacterium]
MPHSATAPPSEELLSATVEVLADTLGLRDGETRAHCTRVVDLAERLGRRLGLADDSLRELGYAARVHDIGKVGVPDAVLYKTGPLDELEAELLREHSGWGAELVNRIPGLERVAEIVRHHHERFDGGGYPDGLEADEVLLESRILAVADAYVAMNEDRPYRPALEPRGVAGELKAGRGRQFDPVVLDALEAELPR